MTRQRCEKCKTALADGETAYAYSVRRIRSQGTRVVFTTDEYLICERCEASA